MTLITSNSNPQFRTWKTLLTSKGMRKEGLFLVTGEKLIRELMRVHADWVVAELVRPGLSPLTSLRASYELVPALFNELDELGTHFNILIAKLPEISPWNPAAPAQGLEVFCPLGDPKNVGALLRSCEAFSVSKVILLEEAANPFLPSALKASAGSSWKIKLEKGPRLSQLGNLEFVALDLDGENLQDFQWPSPARLLVGEEGPGLREASSQMQLRKIKIPTSGVESLNASVAAGITLFHYAQQKQGIKRA